jgi:hypothetical protein
LLLQWFSPRRDEKGTGCKSRTLPDAVSFIKRLFAPLATVITTGRPQLKAEVSQKTCLCTYYLLLLSGKKAQLRKGTAIATPFVFLYLYKGGV